MTGYKRSGEALTYASLATMEKHLPFKQDTQGSNPWRGTVGCLRCRTGTVPDF